MTDDGGPAFPLQGEWSAEGQRLEHIGHDGMTLLDYTAIQMFPWVLNETGQTSHKQLEKLGFDSWHDHAASEAYKLAAALLRARRELMAVEQAPIQTVYCQDCEKQITVGSIGPHRMHRLIRSIEPEPAAVDPDFPAAKVVTAVAVFTPEQVGKFHAQQQHRSADWPCSCGNVGVCGGLCPHFAAPCIEECKCPCSLVVRMACTHPRYRPVGDHDGMECISCGHLAIKMEIAECMLYCQDCDMRILDRYWDAHQRTNPTHKIGRSL